MYKHSNEKEYKIEQYTIEKIINKYTKQYTGYYISKVELDGYFIYIINYAKEHNHIPQNYFFNREELYKYMNSKYGSCKHGKWNNVVFNNLPN